MKKDNIFWISYSDLMTSLFFVMLVLFIVSITYLELQNRSIERDRKATEEQLEKINEIQTAIQNIDSTYFVYNEMHKKHILNIPINFKNNSANIMDLSFDIREKLKNAGSSLITQMTMMSFENPEVQYVIIIEGQASKDNAPINDELSYQRAIALRDFWLKEIDSKIPNNCEVIIAGSGQYGVPREFPDIPPANQRFLVTVLPKPGIIKQKNEK